MPKKIIFVGPPAAGKTSLRRVFMQYESAEHVLAYEEDPTYGIETIVLNFGEKIGVFDLAGQENDKWLNSGDDDIFNHATHILVVISADTGEPQVIDFIKKVIVVRNRKCVGASVYVLIHKIDLLESESLKGIKHALPPRFKDEQNFSIYFTSIKKNFFIETLEFFKNLIREISGEEILLENIDYNRIKTIISFFNQFEASQKLSRSDLESSLKIPSETIDEIIEILHARGYIRIYKVKKEFEYEITIENKGEFIALLREYSKNKLFKFQKQFSSPEVRVEIEAPPFIGILFGDDSGKNLITVEAEKGIFNKFLGITEQNELDLIPPFISAIENFSKELRVIDITDFKLKGKNLAIYVMSFGNIHSIFFLNPNTNINEYKDEIISFLDEFFKENGNVFKKMIRTGIVKSLDSVIEQLTGWIRELNSKYKEKVDNLEFFDFNNTKVLFKKINKFSELVKEKVKKVQNSLEEIENKLVQAVMNKDLEKVKMLFERFQNLQLNFYNRD
ncbi:MAG: Rab family GTPase [Promethearchaeota archaeon]